MIKFLKNPKFYLQLWDGIWSVPLSLLLFVGSGYFVQWFFSDPNIADGGGAPGFYDPSFIQAAFYASAMMVFINFTVWLGLYFSFRAVWKYYVGKRDENKVTINKSKEDFNNLKSWQRILVLLGLYFSLSLEWVVLFSLLR